MHRHARKGPRAHGGRHAVRLGKESQAAARCSAVVPFVHDQLVDDLLGRRLVRGQVGQGQHAHGQRVAKAQQVSREPEKAGAATSDHRATGGSQGRVGRLFPRARGRSSTALGCRR